MTFAAYTPVTFVFWNSSDANQLVKLACCFLIL
jgi:hypothetical protein